MFFFVTSSDSGSLVIDNTEKFTTTAPPLTNHSQPHPRALPQTTRGHPSPRRPTLSGRQTGSIPDLAHDSRLSINRAR
nr:hypothetical protein [Mycobacterium tuberculosis]